MPDFDVSLGDHIEDDMLRLIFICCHPLLSTEARVTLTLRLIGGLTTKEIPGPSSRTRQPSRSGSSERSAPWATRGSRSRHRASPSGPNDSVSVLEVLYLVFNEGYSATAGDDWMRPALCEEALRVGRALAELDAYGTGGARPCRAHGDPGVSVAARVGAGGEPVLLLDQNRARWDQLLIRRGLRALDRAESLGEQRGPYVLQASIAACHARARTADETDWARIVSIYDALASVSPSPVVELNRAVALSMADGAQAGLDLVDQLAAVPSMRGYHLLPSVRGDLLAKLGRTTEAREEFERAASLTANEQERALLLHRAATCHSSYVDGA